MLIGFCAEWRAGSRGQGDTEPPANASIRRAGVLRRSQHCAGRCPAAHRFSCPRACEPLRWESRAIPARPAPKLFGKGRAEGVLLRFCMPRPFFLPSFQSIFDPMCDRPARRRAILFCPLRSAIACRQICRNARSGEKRFRICMIGPLFQLSGSKESARLPIPIWILSRQSASPSGEMASVSSSKRRTFAPETERLPTPRSISAL